MNLFFKKKQTNTSYTNDLDSHNLCDTRQPMQDMYTWEMLTRNMSLQSDSAYVNSLKCKTDQAL